MADDLAPSAQQDEVADKRTPEQIAKHWQIQLDLAEKDHKAFWDAGEKVIKRYKSEKDKLSRGAKRLNIFYSNIDYLRAAVYGKSAVPDVRRRFGLEDKVAQTVAEIIEKALVYCNETYDADAPIELGLLDYLITGRGVVRVCYDPVLGEGPDGQEVITEQHVYEKYIYWKDFRHMPCRCWADIMEEGWVSFTHKFDRTRLRKEFPDVAEDVPMNWEPDLGDKRGEVSDTLKKSEVFEIWDVTDRKRYWIVKGYKLPLRIDDDPYGLEEFFPLAEPPSYYKTTDTLVPEPELHAYQDQVEDLDAIVGRISALTKALKRRGVYDQSVKELSRLANAGDNTFIPVENYQALATKGGLAAAFQSEDISLIAAVLIQLYQQRDMLIKAIWEIVGIADIQRGASNPNETLGAQQLKAQFGGQRMMKRQRNIQKWVASLLKIKAEIIAEHFEPQQLQMMTGEVLIPEPPQPTGDPQQDMQAQQQFMQAQQRGQQIIELLRSDKLRSYRIDVETDSTVFEDAAEEKKTRSEMIQAVTSFMQGWGPAVDQNPPLAPLAFELLKFGVGGFKSTRSIDDAIEQVAAKFEQKMQQPKPPPPEMMKMQAEMQMKQAEMQGKQQEAQQKAQIEQAKLQAEQQLKEQQAALEAQKMQMEMAFKERELELKQRELEMKLAAQERELQIKAAEQMQMKAERDEERAFNRAQMVEDRDYERGMMMDERNYTRAERAEERDYGRAERNDDRQFQRANPPNGSSDRLGPAIIASQQGIAAAIQAASAPRRRVAVRDEDGRISESRDEML